MSAVPTSPTLCVVDDSDPLAGELADVPPAPAGLLEVDALEDGEQLHVSMLHVPFGP